MSEQCNDTAISQEVAPQSSPFQQPSPRIPYECLYYVVDYLHDDFDTLKSLLYANKFFFHAVLPHFIRDPHSNPAMSRKWRNHWTTHEKFLALILTSFLEARLKEFKIPPEAGELAELGISKITEHFGLQLVKPFTIPGHQMLRSFLKRIDDKSNTHQNSGGDDLKGIEPTMTTDYSKFVADIPRFDEIPIRAYLMIRLCKLPAKMRAGRIQHPQKVDDKVEEHTLSQQRDHRYKEELYNSLTKLWDHFNRQHILSYSLDMTLAQNFLSFSKEMAKLQTLRLDRPLDMTDSHGKHCFVHQAESGGIPTEAPIEYRIRQQLGYT
ncbi:hypothetical protein BGZ80_007333 [Entomortierella chlamydospora]|uniref:Uncharacterized protein n=1 Tax=Entomortierella chlamydospora TaxID=101097 RepID=A0A9P6MYV9_9FUNG|nr:hypothetical protein BGZ80_007333 [Entomortierella chlamydospora]